MTKLAGPEADPSRRVDLVSRLVGAALTLLLVLLVGRVFQLQVAPADELRPHMGTRMTSVAEPAARGDILDQRGRPLAMSTFGYRAVVDPVEFANPPEEALGMLSRALDLPEDRLGTEIVGAMAFNENAKVANAELGEGVTPTPLKRFVVVSEVLDDSRLEAIRRLDRKKCPGVHLEVRPVRGSLAESLVGPILGRTFFDPSGKETGLMGVEKKLNDQVRPEDGRFRYVRDASGRPLWIDSEGYRAPKPGKDARLSIDLEIQRFVTEELTRGVDEARAQGGRCIILDPNTGEVLAMADLIRHVADAVPYDWVHPIPKDAQPGKPRYIIIPPDEMREKHPDLPALHKNRCVEQVYEPGSTFKCFMWSATTELGLADPAEIVNTEGGHWTTPYGRYIEDVHKYDSLTWAEVLVHSSNIGMSKVTRRMSDQQMRSAVLRFGFGRRTGIDLGGESAGLVTSAKGWGVYTQTSVAMGHEVCVTPVQMVRAFSAFARTGSRAGTIPAIRLTAADPEDPALNIETRVLPPAIADLTRQTLRGVTHNLDQKLAARNPPEAGWRYELFGKSGTAQIPLTDPPPGKKRPKGSDGYFRNQYNSSFIAGGPVENPRLVCIVVIDDPAPELIPRKMHYGAQVAGPVVRRIMERALTYLGLPASPPPSPDRPVGD
ncbi:MAG: penicillin-binding protein 2 [Phycisphaerae bacterium]|nr:penicillin-binding protein 2 [Phycisphaerae bacterium]